LTAKIVISNPFRAGIFLGLLFILGSFGIEFVLLRQLPVFNTVLGLWILFSGFLVTAAILLILIVSVSFGFSRIEKRTASWKPWIAYCFILGLACFIAVTAGLTDGLNLDVKYSTFLTKAGIDYLNLQYLGGAVIGTTLVLVILFMLSDPRISSEQGDDGKNHFYMHSKLLGLLRLLYGTNLASIMRSRRRDFQQAEPSRPSVDWDVGDTPDHPVISRNNRLQWNEIAVRNIGISTGTQTVVNGTLTGRIQYDQGGNTRWILSVNTGSVTVQFLAKAETLSNTDIFKINNTNMGSPISLVVDNTTTSYATVIRIQ
jgi:hypothetical protein